MLKNSYQVPITVALPTTVSTTLVIVAQYVKVVKDTPILSAAEM